ncbi:hypothetical protein EDB81DRAFT_230860 [Dactylonectria macrodidyma]|uniref:Uncharacterized protein n=1 Tax=Dactylonectria macrodidyma TaxID=307937 RepID=A0A9P9DJ45_9HYPO|nr:hypothetical protein EDB81DRAFT_230860 [Dactylonectria macrodidyma]
MTSDGNAAPPNQFVSPMLDNRTVPGRPLFQHGSPASNSFSSNNTQHSFTAAQGRQGSRAPSIDASEKFFACPFFKLDLNKHQDCASIKLKRGCDVTQHFKRCHLMGGDYCPKCRREWPDGPDSEQERIDHARRGCKIVPYQGDGKLLETDLILFKPPMSLRGPDKWVWIWEKLFPGLAAPYPYRVDIVTETARFFCDKTRLLLPQHLVDFGAKEGHTISQGLADSLIRFMAQNVFEPLPHHASAAGTQQYFLAGIGQSTHAIPGSQSGSQSVPDSNSMSQYPGQYQLPTNNHSQDLSHMGSSAQADSWMEQFPLSQTHFGLGVENGMDEAIYETTTCSTELSNNPNPQQLGPLVSCQGCNSVGYIQYINPFQSILATVPHNLPHNPAAQTTPGSTVFPHGQQHPK